MKNLKVKKLLSKATPTSQIKKKLCKFMVGDSIVKHLHGKPIANKTSRNNIILVTPFLELVIKP